MKSTLKKPVAIVGYSGHAYVIIDILLSAGRLVTAYCDSDEKEFNPYHLEYLGKESDVINKLKRFDFFACVGHNGIREKIHTSLSQYLGNPINAIHPSAVISSSVNTYSQFSRASITYTKYEYIWRPLKSSPSPENKEFPKDGLHFERIDIKKGTTFTLTGNNLNYPAFWWRQ